TVSVGDANGDGLVDLVTTRLGAENTFELATWFGQGDVLGNPVVTPLRMAPLGAALGRWSQPGQAELFLWSAEALQVHALVGAGLEPRFEATPASASINVSALGFSDTDRLVIAEPGGRYVLAPGSLDGDMLGIPGPVTPGIAERFTSIMIEGRRTLFELYTDGNGRALLQVDGVDIAGGPLLDYAIADFDADGRQDILLLEVDQDDAAVLRILSRDWEGRWAPTRHAHAILAPANAAHIAADDFDGDGLVDIVFLTR
ncbi:MAG: hypothetical protein ACI9U2_003549, partial [Bradymonadia bacterium]